MELVSRNSETENCRSIFVKDLPLVRVTAAKVIDQGILSSCKHSEVCVDINRLNIVYVIAFFHVQPYFWY